MTARARTTDERLDAIERLLVEVRRELGARKRRGISRAQKVARRAESAVRVLPDPMTQAKAARILRRHAAR